MRNLLTCCGQGAPTQGQGQTTVGGGPTGQEKTHLKI